MKIESLIEMVDVAKYCINFDKLKNENWKIPGCYGYPAALLLLAVVEGIGAHVEGGGDDSKIHFKILNNKDWFNLKLSEPEIDILRRGFRNKLSHQTILKDGLVLNKGNISDVVSNM